MGQAAKNDEPGALRAQGPGSKMARGERITLPSRCCVVAHQRVCPAL